MVPVLLLLIALVKDTTHLAAHRSKEMTSCRHLRGNHNQKHNDRDVRQEGNKNQNVANI